MLRALTVVIAAGLVAAGAVQCDRSGGEPGAQERRVVACDLLTRRDAHEALGSPVAAPVATVDEGADALAGRSGCAWSTRDDHAAALLELVRTRDMAGTVRRTGFSASSRFDAAAARHPGAPVDDVAERAFWVEDEATLHVLVRGRSYLVVEVAVPSPSLAREVARRVASPAVARLIALEGQTDDGHE